MGFYAPAQIVRDAQDHGVEVLPVDVNHSAWDCTLEHTHDIVALRLGMRLVKGLSQDVADGIATARQHEFQTIQSLWQTSGVPVERATQASLS